MVANLFRVSVSCLFFFFRFIFGFFNFFSLKNETFNEIFSIGFTFSASIMVNKRSANFLRISQVFLVSTALLNDDVAAVNSTLQKG